MMDVNKMDWDKMDGLIPAIVQDADTRQVLMLGYMNAEALEKTKTTKNTKTHKKTIKKSQERRIKNST